MKNRKIRKQKVNLKKIVLMLAIVIIGCIITMGNNNTFSHTNINYKTIYVANGETLWEIASVEAQNNSYYAKYDIRHIIKDIKQINDLKSSSVYPGQSLLVPNM